MILELALRSLLSRPIRSAVLVCGFGLGVSVMAALLGIGEVILEQARAPELAGGGDVIIGGASGRVPNPGFVLSSVLGTGALASRVAAAAPTSRATIYLTDDRGVLPIQARAGIPSLERALKNPETSGVASWTDTPADRAWISPDREQVLRAIDRFHAIPDVPERAGSWAEWLYFNGRAGEARFYLAFLAGPELEPGRRSVTVRLQLERHGRMSAYSDSTTVDAAALLAAAPDITAGKQRVRLIGREYRIAINLSAESGSGRAAGDIVVRATPGRSLPPLSIRGAGGWVSGYVVPVMSGDLDGTIRVDNDVIDLAGGSAYHDHNWGFWEGVRWQWGQVHGGGVSLVYGRLHPPADAAEASRIPGFLVALDPNGLIGYATNVTIDETNAPGSNQPQRIVVRGRSDTLSLSLDLAVEHSTVTSLRPSPSGAALDFLQLRARYHVSGRAGDKEIAFTAPGSAETFRGKNQSIVNSP